jgi:hypothetical protein
LARSLREIFRGADYNLTRTCRRARHIGVFQAVAIAIRLSRSRAAKIFAQRMKVALAQKPARYRAQTHFARSGRESCQGNSRAADFSVNAMTF